MNMIDTAKLAQAGLTEPARPGAGSGQSTPEPPSITSEFEAVRAAGFPWLHFPPTTEAIYQKDIAAERLRKIGSSILLGMLLSNGMLVTDWLMVRDLFDTAVAARLYIYTPAALFLFFMLKRLPPAMREHSGLILSALLSCITVYLSLRSQSTLAPTYLVCLTLPMLFTSGVAQTGFWMAIRINAAVIAIFAAAVFNLRDPPVAIMISLVIVILSTSVFTLFGIYWHERDDRGNWLLRHHEQVLLAELNAGNHRLDRLSRHDALTDLANRRHADEFLQRVWSRARQSGEAVAVLMMDVDHFKRYNDHYGHPEGDACLQAVASALKQRLRLPEDLVARFGGEEFIAILPGSSLREATLAAERIREGVERLQRPHESAPALRQVTVSIGVASMTPQQLNASPAALIAAADAALYQAKSAGRNQVASVAPRETGNSKAPPTPAEPRITPERAAQPAPPEPLADPLDMPASKLGRLRFPGSLEQQFLNDRAPDRLRYAGISGLLALFVFDGFLLADFLMAPDVFDVALKLRLMYFTPVALLFLLLPWLGRSWVLRATPPQLTEVVVLSSGVIAAACLAYILSLSQSPTSQYYHVGLMVVITYGNIVQRLRFWYAALFSAIVYAMHIGGVMMVPAFNQQLILPIVALVGATTAFTLMANYAMERDERWRYLLSLRRTRLMNELAEVHQRLQNLSRMDALTGLYNRRHFQEYLQQVWRRAQHHNSDVSIIMLDIDHFKLYNDRYGHPAGDRCLAQVAEALASCLRRPGDLVARYGGEEFIALLPHADLKVAIDAAQRIRQAVESLGIRHEGSTTSAIVTVSIGVANCKATPRQIDTSLVSAADMALYEAKRGGRNRVSIDASAGQPGHQAG